MHNIPKNSTLLQTAIAMVNNFSKRKSEKSAIFFDTGSQRSFISIELREKIRFANNFSGKFLIKLLSKSESKLQKCDIVLLKVFTRNNKALILELICTSVITSFAFQHQVRHEIKKCEDLRNLK